MRTKLAVLFGLLAILTAGLAVPAQAAEAATPTAVEVTADGFSAQAWECPSGDFCVWENTGGTGRRCNWTNADPDWWGGSIVCSWADDTPVESAFDNGNDSRFLSVEVFTGANYTGRFACLRRGVLYDITAGGVRLRSHRWATFTC